MNVQAVAAEEKAERAGAQSCRLCGGHAEHTFVDLGMSPLCESFLLPDQLDAMEPYFPLRAGVCGDLPEHIFNEHAYFSSFSTSWVAHAKAYCEMIAARLGLGADSLVVELASNDGYLLQHFLPLGVPVLGIDPKQYLCPPTRSDLLSSGSPL